MTKIIYKYQMPSSREERVVHQMPLDAEFLCLKVQDGRAQAWFILRAQVSENVNREFSIYGTGQNIPMSSKYLGTYQEGIFVWHVFETGGRR